MKNQKKYRQTLALIYGAGFFFALGFFTTTEAQRSSTLAGGSPLMSYEKALLRREDVQNELYLYSLQKEFLTEFVNQTPGGNISNLERALQKAGNTDYTIKILPKANHRFEESLTGANDFATTKRIVPGYYDVMFEWLKKRVNLR